MNEFKVFDNPAIGKLYLILALYGPKTPEEIAYMSRVKIEDVRVFLERLHENELIDFISDPLPRYAFIPPVRYLISLSRKRFLEIKNNLVELSNLIDKSGNYIEGIKGDVLGIVRGGVRNIQKSINDSLEHVISHIKRDVQNLASESLERITELMTLNESIRNNIIDLKRELNERRTNYISLINELGESCTETLGKTFLNLSNATLNLRKMINEDLASAERDMLQMFSESISTMEELLNKGIVDIKELNNTFSSQVAALIGDLKPAVNQIVSEAESSLGNIVTAALDVLTHESKGILDRFDLKLEEIKRDALLTSNKIIRRLTGFREEVVSLLKSSMGTIKSEFENKLGAFTKEILDEINESVNEINEIKKECQSKIIESLINLKENIRKESTLHQNVISNLLSQTIESTKREINALKEMLGTIIDEALETLRVLMKTYEEHISESLEDSYATISYQIQGILKLFEEHKLQLEERTSQLLQTIDSLKDSCIKDAENSLKLQLDEILNKLKNTLEDLTTRVSEETRSFFKDIAKRIEGEIARYSVSIKRDGEKINEAVVTLDKNVKKAFENILKVLSEKGYTLDDETRERLESEIKSIRKDFRSLRIQIRRYSDRQQEKLGKMKVIIDMIISHSERIEKMLHDLYGVINESIKNRMQTEVKNIEDNLKRFVSTYYEKVNTEVSWLKSSLVNTFEKIFEDLSGLDSQIINSIDTTIRDVLGSGKSVLEARLKESEQIRSQFNKNLASVIKSLDDILIDASEKIRSDFNKHFTVHLNKIDEAIKHQESAYDEFVNSVCSIINARVEGISNRMKEHLKALMEPFIKTEKSIVEGMDTFIATMKSNIEGSFNSIVSNISKLRSDIQILLDNVSDRISVEINAVIEDIKTRLSRIKEEDIAKISNLEASLLDYLSKIEEKINDLNALYKNALTKRQELVSSNLSDKLSNLGSALIGILEDYDNKLVSMKEHALEDITTRINSLSGALQEIFDLFLNSVEEFSKNIDNTEVQIRKCEEAINNSCAVMEKNLVEASESVSRGVKRILSSESKKIEKEMDIIFSRTKSAIITQLSDYVETLQKELGGIIANVDDISAFLQNTLESIRSRLGNSWIAFGKESLEAYVYSLAERTREFAIFVIPEEIESINEYIKKVPDGIHIEIISQPKILSKFKDVSRPIVLRKIIPNTNVFLIIRDGEEALIGFRERGNMVTHIIFSKDVIESLQKIIPTILA